jgi:hypothetical protein
VLKYSLEVDETLLKKPLGANERIATKPTIPQSNKYSKAP